MNIKYTINQIEKDSITLIDVFFTTIMAFLTWIFAVMFMTL